MDLAAHHRTIKRKKSRNYAGLWMLLDFLEYRFGGGKRDRTADLLHAMQALSQLSYTPTRNPIVLLRPQAVKVQALLCGIRPML